MVVNTEDNASSLLSTPSKEKPFILERKTVDYEDYSVRFSQEKQDYSVQFAHVYSARLNELKDILIKEICKKWGSIRIVKLAELEEVENERCVIIGTQFKHQQWKPSILKELGDDHDLIPTVPRNDYCSEKDVPFLEDEMLRVKLVGDKVNIKDIVTGIVCAVLGHEKADGTFEVEDWCFPGCAPKTITPEPVTKGKVLILSGLDMVHHSQSLSQSLLTEWICGMAGNSIAQAEEASIVRVIIAGNGVRSSPEIFSSTGLYSGKAKDREVYKETAEGTKRLDSFINELAQCCLVTLMPGQHDPTGVMLPQKPLHPCMLPKSSRYENFTGVANPWSGKIGTRVFLGTSGQPIEDIMRVSGLANGTPLEWLAKTLVWRHLCPTAPDTLPSYPYCGKDLFIIHECPDIYFVSNMDKFETKLWIGQDGQRVRLISVPQFSTTNTAVLVDLDSLDTQIVSFGTS
ncbi:DNA polymerase delta small subunit [Cephus cinctus]|uniref:DNA polymerase delta small subunit n=1 Tax=Cephus cinctus TaxID=211228 RepID=A0AAJ7BQT6_CEPCN|nr:DNA polymerase delta small subunit [Cephus cinctus]